MTPTKINFTELHCSMVSGEWDLSQLTDGKHYLVNFIDEAGYREVTEYYALVKFENGGLYDTSSNEELIGFCDPIQIRVCELEF